MCVLLGGFPKFPVDPYYEPLAWFMIFEYNIASFTKWLNQFVMLQLKSMLYNYIKVVRFQPDQPN